MSAAPNRLTNAHLSGDFEGPQPQLTKADLPWCRPCIHRRGHHYLRHHTRSPSTTTASLRTVPVAFFLLLHHAIATNHAPLPAGKMRSANSFRHLFRHGPTLLHLLRRRRHRHRTPEAVLIQPRLWPQRLADALNHVAGRNNEFGCWSIWRLVLSDGLRLIIFSFGRFDCRKHTTIKCMSRGEWTREGKVQENTTINQPRYNNPPQQDNTH